MNKYQKALENLEKLENTEWISDNEWNVTKKDLKELVDKATPKNPYCTDYGDHFDNHCRVCHKLILTITAQSKIGDYVPKYCHYCGQKLSWS